MKKTFKVLYILLIFTGIIFNTTSAQVGIGTAIPNTSSMLDVSSTSKGVLLPRLTKIQRNGISSPATGLLIFQTDDTTGFYFFNGGWQQINPSLSAFANSALSNLIMPTAVNVDLLPKTTAVTDLGSVAQNWRHIYVSGDVYIGNTRFISDKGNGNNLFGGQAGDSITSGTYNTATGYRALFYNKNGYSNTANGYNALYTNTNTYNSAFGYQALYYNTNGYANSASGAFALYSNTTGSYNTAFGPDALIGNTTGASNTAVGLDALRNINTTSYNTGIGYYAGENTYTTIQGTFLGAQTRGGTGLSNVTAVGYGATATASNQIMLGNTSVSSVKAAGSFVVYSDGRFKNDIRDDVPGLDFINQLRPVTYHYNIHDLNTHINPVTVSERQGVTLSGQIPTASIDEKSILEKEKKLYTGFIAQEVEDAAKKLNYDFSGVYKPANGHDAYGLSYNDFVVPLVKAVQELSKENKEMKEQLAVLKQQVDKLTRDKK